MLRAVMSLNLLGCLILKRALSIKAKKVMRKSTLASSILPNQRPHPTGLANLEMIPWMKPNLPTN